ncbi:hypothetical protein L228DRAFT_172933 [Xylona heveae TC161]|uniref:Uncharacterized protein n=1 Tax=Xylona heveae (strain CBS 132557 / TC161) TaxID=1328760 RepID=A0A165FW11_XYLHT|nr:hypothetical protein L228DRAFT_172933 [Xylona heveae TC161]KZF21448.1 hypothetical protein L228DRAFT_172933 [Xylona heveae TC161]
MLSLAASQLWEAALHMRVLFNGRLTSLIWLAGAGEWDPRAVQRFPSFFPMCFLLSPTEYNKCIVVFQPTLSIPLLGHLRVMNRTEIPLPKARNKFDT